MIPAIQEAIDIAAQTTQTGIGYASPGASQQGADGTLATFYYRQVQDQVATETEGRPIFNDVAYVEIRLPGQKNTIVNRAVQDEDTRRWPEAWQRFQAKQTGFVGGTPLTECGWLPRTRVAELQASNVHTVEALAGMENPGDLGPDGQKLRKRAKEFLQGDSDTVRDLRKDLKAAQDQIKALEAQLNAAMQPAQGETEEPVRRGPGRPRKHPE